MYDVSSEFDQHLKRLRKLTEIDELLLRGNFTPGAFRVDKYWPPVNRVDNAYGDRHLVCTCPPMDDYAEAAE